jgi:hypothetical protein
MEGKRILNREEYSNFKEEEYIYNKIKGFGTTAIHAGQHPE